MKKHYATLLAGIGLFLLCISAIPAKAVVTFTRNPISGVLVLVPDTNLVCPNNPHEICFTLNDPNPAVQILITGDNHLTFSATAGTSTMSAFTGQNTNTVSGCFKWTPNETDEGVKELVISSNVNEPGKDPYTRTDTIKIFTAYTLEASKDDTICFEETTTVTVLKGGLNDYQWEIYPTHSLLGIVDPKLRTTDVFPGVTTTYIVEATDRYNGCKRKDYPALSTNQDLVTVVVVNPKIDVGPDTSVCVYTTLQLNANLINPQPGITYAWKWTPEHLKDTIFLSDRGIVNPVMRIPAGMDMDDVPDSVVLYLDLIPSLARCKKQDTLVVQILKGFYITTGDQLGSYTGLGHKFRQKGVSDTAICAGQTITIQGWGDKRYDYSWTPAAGVSTPLGYIPGTTTITPAATTTYALTASHKGCRDSTKNVIITVEPIPVVDAGPDRTICAGDTIHFLGSVTPSPDVFTEYTYEWSPGGSLSRTDTLYGYFTGYVTEELTLKVTTPAGCSGQDKVTYTVAPRQFLSVSQDTMICPDDQATLHVRGDDLLESVLWSPAERIDDPTSLDPVVSPLHSTRYVVTGRDKNSCVDSAVVNVTLLPRAVIYLEDSVHLYPGQVYHMNPQSNCLYFSWFPLTGLNQADIADPIANPDLNTTYIVTGRTDAGCITKDSIYVVVMPDSRIDVPNAFNPNNGENGTFRVLHLGDATLNKFMVFNRWGEKLFETSDINTGWDGSFKGQAQSFGVYVYLVEAVTAKGSIIRKQGNVTLIR